MRNSEPILTYLTLYCFHKKSHVTLADSTSRSGSALSWEYPTVLEFYCCLFTFPHFERFILGGEFHFRHWPRYCSATGLMRVSQSGAKLQRHVLECLHSERTKEARREKCAWKLLHVFAGQSAENGVWLSSQWIYYSKIPPRASFLKWFLL